MTIDLHLTDHPAGVAGTSPWGAVPARRDAVPDHVDLLVVGAGVAGLAVARTAWRSGVGSVHVLEAGGIGEGASSRNAGALIPDVHALAVGPDEAALGRRGLALHRALADELGYPLRPVTWVSARADRPDPDRLAASGARWLPDRAAVASATGGAVLVGSAVVVPDQAATDPVALMTAQVAALPGVTAGVRVERIQSRRAGGVAVATTAGTIAAGTVVLATGTAPSAWLPTRRRWVTGHLALTAPVPGLPPGLAVGRDTVVVPRGDGRLLVGGTRDGERVTGRVDDDVLGRVRRELVDLVPTAAGVGFEHVWTGQRPVVDDDLPLIDEVDDDVLVVAGLFHTGVLTSPAVAEAVVARLRDGRWPALVAPFRRRAR